MGNVADSKAILVRGDYSTNDSGELLYSLDKARKCAELEAAGLLCGDPMEGRAEFARRQSAAIFNGCVQQCEGDVGGRVWKHGSPCPYTTMMAHHRHHLSRPFLRFHIRFLPPSDGPEQRAQHQRKLAIVQHLAKQCVMTAILETHVTGAKAELFFCRCVEGTRRFLVHGMAVTVQEVWANHFNPSLETVVDGVIIALVWKCGHSRQFAFFLRLDAHAEATRIQQLRQANPMGKRACLQRRRPDLRC